MKRVFFLLLLLLLLLPMINSLGFRDTIHHRSRMGARRLSEGYGDEVLIARTSAERS